MTKDAIIEEEVITDEVIDTEIQEKPFYKRFFFYFWLVLIIATITFNLLFCITIVSGESMYPTLHNNQILVAQKNPSTLHRFDIVIIEDEKPLIKRVIGLPNETIEYKDNILYINGNPIEETYGYGHTNDFSYTIDENSYFCLGDNRENSADSRVYGAFNKEEIVARLLK